ncbi:chemotaxis protein CheD [Desulfurivibrio sp. D14AmB]|uniref:chemotaxis protein CheD n=1 Tax=Desulfurivibrio sp. D14AmB TaxID=3374370 RepID=UPI00376EF642
MTSSNKVVGVGEFAVSANPGEKIKTFALGSCVAVIFLHRPSRSVGLIHVALPDSAISPDIAAKRPGYFADTGISAILKDMATLTGTGTGNGLARGMVVKMAGGANVMDSNNTFNIGKRNILALKKILWPLGMGPTAEDVGGGFSRTVTVGVASGRVMISCAGKGEWEL